MSHFSGDDIVLCLSEKIGDRSLEILMKLGLRIWFPNECAAWEKRREEIKQRILGSRTERQKEMHAELERNFEDLKVRLREAVIIEVLKAFPWVMSVRAPRQVGSYGRRN